MGMINKKNGNYLRIIEINIKDAAVHCVVYPNKEYRDRERNGEVFLPGILQYATWNTAVFTEQVLESNLILGKTALDGLRTLCYQKMLEDSAFIDWQSDEIIN